MKEGATKRARFKPSCVEARRRFLYSTKAVEKRISKDPQWNTKPRRYWLRYLVDAILRQRLGMGRMIKSRSKPVNLHSKALKGAIGDRHYRQALQWLMDEGLVGTDGEWRKGEKATGYFLTKRGWWGGIVPVELEDDRQAARYLQARARLKKDSDKKREAEGVPLDYLRFHLGKLNWPDGAVEEHFSNLPVVERWQDAAKVEAHEYSVSLVLERDYTFTRDRAGRFYYALTNTPKALRQRLQYAGEDMVQIDVSSCHPFLASWFYNGIQHHQGVEEERARYLADLKGPSFYRGIAEAAVESITREWSIRNREYDREYYRRLRFVQQRGGQVDRSWIREQVIELNRLHKKREAVSTMLEQGGHKAIKKEVLKSVFFGGIAQMETSSISGGFSRLYPLLFGHLASKKINLAPWIPHRHPKRVGGIEFTHWRNDWKGDSELALLLQGVEARIVIDGALARIAREMPGVPAFPIHDCLMTLERHATEVERIMAEEFVAAMGIAPSFKVERMTKKVGSI